MNLKTTIVPKRLLLFFFIIASFNFYAQSNSCDKVRGKIIDEKTKSPISEIKLQLKSIDNKEIFTTISDKNGVFKFTNIPFNTYTLNVIDKEYNPKKLNELTLKEEHEKLYQFNENMPFTASKKVTWMFNWGDFKGKEHYWSHFTAKIILGIYTFCLLMIFFYSVLQLNLTWIYSKTKRRLKDKDISTPDFKHENAPKVTIQLPMFNEMYVAERIIEVAAKIEYPRDRFQIQVLDDSSDETKDIIASKVKEISEQGINIQHIHRIDRTGYKAGALDAAMDQVEGEFIAIFDSDFMPEPY